jgi:hypothetical protein
MYVPMYCKQVALSIQFKNWERAVHVSQHSPRLRCKPCDQTFTATVTEVDTTRQMTDRLVKWVGRQSLAQHLCRGGQAGWGGREDGAQRA